MAAKKTGVDALLKQRAEIDAAIKQAKKIEAKQKAETRAQRALVIGLAVLAEIDKGNNPNIATIIQPIIDRNTTKAKDRTLLGLPPKNRPAARDNEAASGQF